MDLLGGRMGFDAPDHLEHRVTRTGEAEAPVPQGSLRAYHARPADTLDPSSFRNDSHYRRRRPSSRYWGRSPVSREMRARGRRPARTCP
jgi:hypothetical protein